jgi:hypothetical protein
LRFFVAVVNQHFGIGDDCSEFHGVHANVYSKGAWKGDAMAYGFAFLPLIEAIIRICLSHLATYSVRFDHILTYYHVV